jgi:trimeric autotransporter adhesin
MKLVKYLSILAVALGAITVSAGSFATTSTVNPAVPAQYSPLSSATLRSQFQAVYNDVNALWAAIASGTGISALTGDVVASGSGSVGAALSNTATARANIGLGLSSTPTFAGATLTKNITALPAADTGTVLQLGNIDGTAGRVELDAFGAAGHYTVRAFGGTAASPTALAASTTAPIGSFNIFGYNGTSVVGPQAAVRAYATQAWSVGSNGTQLDFAVTPNGSATLTQAMVINQDGGITLGSPTGSDKGASTINAAGSIWSNGTQLQNGSFTAGTNMTITGSWPNLTFSASGGSGSGTVNSGTANQLALYSSTGTAVSGSTFLSATTTGLGVGTSSPTFLLDVGSGAGQQVMRVNGGGSGVNGGPAIFLASGGTSVAALGLYSAINGGSFNSTLQLWTPGSGFLIGNSVNIGGATGTFPNELTVNGNIGMTATGSAPINGVYLSASNTFDISTNTTKALEISSTQTVTAFGPIITKGYTVSTLPTGTVGMRAYVTDQTTSCPAVGATLTGSGAVTCPVFYNGSAWVSG